MAGSSAYQATPPALATSPAVRTTRIPRLTASCLAAFAVASWASPAGSAYSAATTGEFAARRLAAATNMRSYAIPAELPPLPISVAWHARYDAGPEHRWLRSQLQDIARELTSAEASVQDLALRVDPPSRPRQANPNSASV